MFCPLLSIGEKDLFDCIEEKCEWWNIDIKGCDPMATHSGKIDTNLYSVNRGKTKIQLTSTGANRVEYD